MAADAMAFWTKALERLWFGCGGHCHTHGDGGASCPWLDGIDPTAPPKDPEVRRYSRGPALVGAAALVFLLPLATAAGGAFLAGRYLPARLPITNDSCQLLGMLGGLAAGVGLAWVALWLRRPKKTSSGGGDE